MRTLDLKLQAFRDHFELACIAGAVVIVGDLLWVIHDIIYNPFSIFYIFVIAGLVIGLGITIEVLIKHNAYLVKELRHELLINKLLCAHQRVKHDKRSKRTKK